MNDIEDRIVDIVIDKSVEDAINRLQAESEYYKQARIRRQIQELKEQIRRLESCL